MCWSLEVSLATGIWGWFVAAVCWYRNKSPRDRWGALFLSAFTSVQLCEALLWWDIGAVHLGDGTQVPCTQFNRVVSCTLLFGTLVGQLLFNLLGARVSGSKPHPAIVVSVVGFCAFVLARRWYEWSALAELPCTTVTPSGHLLWFGVRYPLYIVFAFSVIHTLPIAVYMRPISAMLLCLACNWGAWLYAATTDSNGSNWCLFGNAWSIVLLLDPWLFGAAKKRNARKGKQQQGKKVKAMKSK
eukprot:TRINITY_DN5053_c0_g1_i1.p3 TRINITY_DN5053_c0_g1~~TRINITY_DN5053_c0_g1_i1.p3  ORF type:complete len:243 (+),score=67.94 TRINITY_DN5053_c0_g1_i1:946-1674(+)